MKKYKVLEVIRQGKIGGGESHVLSLVSGLDKERFEPIVMTFIPGQMTETLQDAGVKCYIIPTERPFDFRVFRQIDEVLKREQIDIIHAHGSRAASNLMVPSMRNKIPMIYTVHGWSFHAGQNPIVSKLRKWIEKMICGYCDRVICVSHSNRMTGVYSFHLRNAAVIENGIDLARFNPANPDIKDVRAELGIPRSEYIIGFVARMCFQKDPITFLKAVEIAHREEPKIKGLMVGDGELSKDVDTYIKHHELRDVIYRQRFRLDVPDVLSAMDVFCLPSLWEGHPIAVLEAMAMGKAIIATPTDGSYEIIKNGKSGLLVDFQNPEMLAEAILRYYRNPEEAGAITQMAELMVTYLYDNKEVAAEVMKIYVQVIEKQIAKKKGRKRQ
jgi:glycosyltransferase involved in cell wall biosynthesis